MGLPCDPVLRAALIVFLLLAVSFTVSFSYFYIKYDRIIERRFRTPVFSNSAKIFAIPQTVRDGEKIDAKEIAGELRRAGYSDEGLSEGLGKDAQSKLGSFRLGRGEIQITPGPESYHRPAPGVMKYDDGEVVR